MLGYRDAIGYIRLKTNTIIYITLFVRQPCVKDIQTGLKKIRDSEQAQQKRNEETRPRLKHIN